MFDPLRDDIALFTVRNTGLYALQVTSSNTSTVVSVDLNSGNEYLGVTFLNVEPFSYFVIVHSGEIIIYVFSRDTLSTQQGFTYQTDVSVSNPLTGVAVASPSLPIFLLFGAQTVTLYESQEGLLTQVSSFTDVLLSPISSVCFTGALQYVAWQPSPATLTAYAISLDYLHFTQLWSQSLAPAASLSGPLINRLGTTLLIATAGSDLSHLLQLDPAADLSITSSFTTLFLSQDFSTGMSAAIGIALSRTMNYFALTDGLAIYLFQGGNQRSHTHSEKEGRRRG